MIKLNDLKEKTKGKFVYGVFDVSSHNRVSGLLEFPSDEVAIWAFSQQFKDEKASVIPKRWLHLMRIGSVSESGFLEPFETNIYICSGDEVENLWNEIENNIVEGE